MTSIPTAETEHQDNHCYICEVTARRNGSAAPLWDCIHRTRYWDVVHSYNTDLPGWLVLVGRRHIEAIDEMTNEGNRRKNSGYFSGNVDL